MQRSFVLKYLAGVPQKKAAIEAGYSARSADSKASQLLSKREIKEAIALHRAKVSKKLEVTQTRILDELADMAFFNVQDVSRVNSDGALEIDFTNANRAHFAAVTKIKTKQRSVYDNRGKVVGTEKSSEIGLADKYRGLEMLGRHAGLFKTEEQRVVIDVADRLLAARARVMRGPLLEHDDGDADEMPEDTEIDHGSTE